MPIPLNFPIISDASFMSSSLEISPDAIFLQFRGDRFYETADLVGVFHQVKHDVFGPTSRNIFAQKALEILGVFSQFFANVPILP
jgi:hypothetical protein